MATIQSEPLIKCDRCGTLSTVSSYHSRLLVKGGFSDLLDRKRGTLITARDLCARCEQQLIAWLDEPTNTQTIDMD